VHPHFNSYVTYIVAMQIYFGPQEGVEEVPGGRVQGSNIGISPHLVHQELEGHPPCTVVFTFFALFVFVHSVACSVFLYSARLTDLICS